MFIGVQLCCAAAAGAEWPCFLKAPPPAHQRRGNLPLRVEAQALQQDVGGELVGGLVPQDGPGALSKRAVHRVCMCVRGLWDAEMRNGQVRIHPARDVHATPGLLAAHHTHARVRKSTHHEAGRPRTCITQRTPRKASSWSSFTATVCARGRRTLSGCVWAAQHMRTSTAHPLCRHTHLQRARASCAGRPAHTAYGIGSSWAACVRGVWPHMARQLQCAAANARTAAEQGSTCTRHAGACVCGPRTA